jgi:16S rRNA (cytosine1402-N4)-methyltransferase
MSTTYHIPVMLNECLEGLAIKPDGVYVDVTFGGGGHSKAILQVLSEKGRVIAFDQDEDAKRNLPQDSRFIFIDQNFEYISNHLLYQGFGEVDGILADLGVSSHQFDEGSRGFSYRYDEAALDMRMNNTVGTSAADILNTADEDSIANIFYLYGELNHSKAMAKKIIAGRLSKRIHTIGDLKITLQSFAPKFNDYKFWGQVFQALRIEVNNELVVLKKFLEQCSMLIKPGGRLVVMSYHSLEDRLVKHFIQSGNVEGKLEKDFYGNLIKPFNAINRKAITANDNELHLNNRARSAKLRIAEKV